MRRRDYILADASVAIADETAHDLWIRAARHECMAKDQRAATLWKARALDYRGQDITARRSLTGMTCIKVAGRYYLAVAYPAPSGPFGMLCPPDEPAIEDILLIPPRGAPRMWSGAAIADGFDARKWALHFAGERYEYLRAKAMKYAPPRKWDGYSVNPLAFVEINSMKAAA